MSKALKCDRCKKYYDPFDKPYVICEKDVNLWLDLCPSCMEKLKGWLKRYEFFEEVAE